MRKSIEKSKKTKNVAILFSGGLDSTYLAYQNLKEGNNVFPYYIEILNNVSKSKIEKQQMAKVASVLRQDLGDNMRYPSMIAKNELNIDRWSDTLKFKQVPIWLLSTLYMDQHFDEIQIGYVANDDSISYLNEIKKTYKAFDWMLSIKGPRPTLTFPLAKKTKYEMLDELPGNLKELIYSCEDPTIYDNSELMNQDSIQFYDNHRLLEFFERNGERKPLLLNFEPCGNCVPCRKIMNDSSLYGFYASHQPIFKKIRMRSIMSEYSDLIRDARYHEDTRTMFNELNTSHQFRNISELNDIDNIKAKYETKQATKEDYKSVGLVDQVKASKEIVDKHSYILSLNKSESKSESKDVDYIEDGRANSDSYDVVAAS